MPPKDPAAKPATKKDPATKKPKAPKKDGPPKKKDGPPKEKGGKVEKKTTDAKPRGRKKAYAPRATENRTGVPIKILVVGPDGHDVELVIPPTEPSIKAMLTKVPMHPLAYNEYQIPAYSPSVGVELEEPGWSDVYSKKGSTHPNVFVTKAAARCIPEWFQGEVLVPPKTDGTKSVTRYPSYGTEERPAKTKKTT